jgi:hypothetical protein
MNRKLTNIAERREQLLKKVAEQRVDLGKNIEPLLSTLSLADKGLSAVRYVKQHPVLAIGATALFGLLQRTRAGKWLRRGWAATLLMRNIRNWLLKS